MARLRGNEAGHRRWTFRSLGTRCAAPGREAGLLPRSAAAACAGRDWQQPEDRARATTSRVTEGAQPSIRRGTAGARPARSFCDRPGAWPKGALTRSDELSEAAALVTIKVVRGRAWARTVLRVLAIMKLRARSRREANQEGFRCQRARKDRRELHNKRLIPTGRRVALDDDLAQHDRCRCLPRFSRGRPAV